MAAILAMQLIQHEQCVKPVAGAFYRHNGHHGDLIAVHNRKRMNLVLGVMNAIAIT